MSSCCLRHSLRAARVRPCATSQDANSGAQRAARVPFVVEGSSVCLVVDGNGRVDARLVGVEINEIIDVVANVALGEGASGEAGGRRRRKRKDRRTY